jgi:hypothetical protein
VTALDPVTWAAWPLIGFLLVAVAVLAVVGFFMWGADRIARTLANRRWGPVHDPDHPSTRRQDDAA